jgi:hypothetical protein
MLLRGQSARRATTFFSERFERRRVQKEVVASVSWLRDAREKKKALVEA